jgi:hypothetical protein
MNAAFMSYEGECRAGVGGHGGHERLCGITGTVARRPRLFKIKIS